jgi:RNA polymerase sigma-70 factor (ECF subfamily)
MMAVEQARYHSGSVVGHPTRECLVDRIEDVIPHLRRYARSLTANVDEADDVVQEALTRALPKLDLFQPGSNLKAWLFTIVRHTFINQIRQRRAFVARADDEPGPVALPRQESHVELAELARAYGRLSPPHREELALNVFAGMSDEEVRELLDLPVGTVRSRLSRARSALRYMVPDNRA